MKGKLFLVLCLLLLLFCLSIARFSQTEPKASNSLPVHNLNTGLNYSTIQEAIDQAGTGDTIKVDSGTYYEHITISHAIRLLGESPESTIIDGNNTDSVVDLGVHARPPFTSNVSIINFTIRNAGPNPTGEFVANPNACVRGVHVQNIDLENNVFLNAGRCIFLCSSSLINVSNNDISNSVAAAVDVGAGSTNVTLSNNFINDYGTFGIEDDGDSRYCKFINNTVENGPVGIVLGPNMYSLLCPANVTLGNNFVKDCRAVGILVAGDTRYCDIISNTVEDCAVGIYFEPDSGTLLAPVDNLIDGNILSNTSGVNLEVNFQGASQESFTNVFRRNNLTNLQHNNLSVFGDNLASFMLDIDSSNLANGKRIYYLTNSSGLEVDPASYSDAEYLALVNCSNVSVKDFDFAGNKDGLLLAGATNCTLTNMTLGDNRISVTYENRTQPSYLGGLMFFGSNNNTVENCMLCNGTYGAWLYHSDWNLFSHNSFIGNDKNVLSGDDPTQNFSSGNISKNFWDNGYPSGGNYWSDYNGTDTNQDGIGDMPYIIDPNNTDHNPLMGTFQNFTVSTPSTGSQPLYVISNSTVSSPLLLYWLTSPYDGIQPGQPLIQFSATGENGTVGFCRLMIPRTVLNSSSYIVLVDSQLISAVELPISNDTYVYLYFTYPHSTHEVIVTIPEYSSFILPLFAIATLIAVALYKKKAMPYKSL